MSNKMTEKLVKVNVRCYVRHIYLLKR